MSSLDPNTSYILAPSRGPSQQLTALRQVLALLKPERMISVVEYPNPQDAPKATSEELGQVIHAASSEQLGVCLVGNLFDPEVLFHLARASFSPQLLVRRCDCTVALRTAAHKWARYFDDENWLLEECWADGDRQRTSDRVKRTCNSLKLFGLFHDLVLNGSSSLSPACPQLKSLVAKWAAELTRHLQAALVTNAALSDKTAFVRLSERGGSQSTDAILAAWLRHLADSDLLTEQTIVVPFNIAHQLSMQ